MPRKSKLNLASPEKLAVTLKSREHGMSFNIESLKDIIMHYTTGLNIIAVV